jgi:hypothetical protein
LRSPLRNAAKFCHGFGLARSLQWLCVMKQARPIIQLVVIASIVTGCATTTAPSLEINEPSIEEPTPAAHACLTDSKEVAVFVPADRDGCEGGYTIYFDQSSVGWQPLGLGQQGGARVLYVDSCTDGETFRSWKSTNGVVYVTADGEQRLTVAVQDAQMEPMNDAAGSAFLASTRVDDILLSE